MYLWQEYVEKHNCQRAINYVLKDKWVELIGVIQSL